MRTGADGLHRFAEEELRRVAQTVLLQLDVPTDLAELTATSLAASNVLGHDSHGVIRLLQYADAMRAGQVRPDARPQVSRRSGAVATVDGNWGLGQPAAQLATELIVELLGAHSLAAVAINRCNHIGRLGEYVETIATAGAVGLAFCNAGPIVAPAGGHRPTFGTNPLAWAVPRESEPPLVLDFSTAEMAEGKVRLLLSRGEAVPPGVIVDSRGQPSTDPHDLYAGGALLPFGGHKGGGLSFMIEVTAGLLSGMGAAPMPDYGGGNGTVLFGLSVEAFTNPAEFGRSVEQFGARVTAAADGTVEPNVRLPGQVERETALDRSARGVPVPDTVRREITELAQRVGAELGTFALGPVEAP